MCDFNLPLIIALLCSLLWLYRTFSQKRRSNPKSLPFPPGPKPLPIIGNVLDLPKSHEWLQVAEWGKIYGDILHVEALGHHLIYLNSLDAANDLLEKRSLIYSDRPMTPMLEIVGWNWGFAFLSYGAEWRRQRKMFHRFFHGATAARYHPIHIKETRRFLSRLLSSPESFLYHCRHLAASTIIKVTYGIDVQDSHDKYVHAAEEALNVAIAASLPGSFLVDVIPILRYVPAWFPGANFKRIGKKWNAITQRFRNLAFIDAKKALAKGDETQSVVSLLLRDLRENKDEGATEESIRDVAAIAYAGGADTTVSLLQSFFLAMVLNPDVQQKAYDQLSSVIGKDRLPQFDDLASLPYIEAMVMELMRWHPVFPLTTPHRLTEDDEYRGYFIPKGSMVLTNAWAILHDETKYPQPFQFNPGRFLNSDGLLNKDIQHPEVACFGFGRRMCPGRHMAFNSLFIAVASVLSMFEITKPLDENGYPIAVADEVTSEFASRPVPFKCSITPRHAHAAEIVRNSAQG